MAYWLHRGVCCVERKGEGGCRIKNRPVSVNSCEGSNGGGGFSNRRLPMYALLLTQRVWYFCFNTVCKRKKHVWDTARKDGYGTTVAVLTKRSWPSFLAGVNTRSLLQAFKLLTCQPPKDYLHVCGCVDFSFMYIDVYGGTTTTQQEPDQYINGCISEPPTSRKWWDVIWLTWCPHCVIHLANHPEA